jgi:hypothetical protein
MFHRPFHFDLRFRILKILYDVSFFLELPLKGLFYAEQSFRLAKAGLLKPERFVHECGAPQRDVNPDAAGSVAKTFGHLQISGLQIAQVHLSLPIWLFAPLTGLQSMRLLELHKAKHSTGADGLVSVTVAVAAK